MASEFFEITIRSGSKTMVLNTSHIIRITDDGDGAVITYASQKKDGKFSVETLQCDETYSEIKTLLGSSLLS